MKVQIFDESAYEGLLYQDSMKRFTQDINDFGERDDIYIRDIRVTGGDCFDRVYFFYDENKTDEELEDAYAEEIRNAYVDLDSKLDIAKELMSDLAYAELKNMKQQKIYLFYKYELVSKDAEKVMELMRPEMAAAINAVDVEMEEAGTIGMGT